MKKIFNIIFAAAVIAGLGSCTYNFEEINTNPNRITVGDVRAYNCFEPIIYGLGSNSQQYTWYWNNELIQMTAFTSGQTRQEHMYQITDGNWQSVWDVYARYGYDCHHMIGLAQNDGDEYLEAVGLILKAYCFSNLVSLFGDVPYDEAYQLSENMSPRFEPQEDVFNKIIADLDRAAAILAENPDPIRTGLDPVYSDDAEGWRKFANSMRMRLLCRMTGGDSNYWAQIQEMVDNPTQYPVFESNDDNAKVSFTGVDPYMSYYGNNRTTESDFTGRRITQQMIKMMAQLDAEGNATYTDPRLSIWAKQRGGVWKGTIAGCTEQEKNAADEGTSLPNYDVICREDMDAFFMDYSEILFIYAEGVLGGHLNMPQTAQYYYEEAVKANMQKWSPYADYCSSSRSISSTNITDYLASELGSWTNAVGEDKLYGSTEELLLSQKWLSLYWVCMEPYNEWRRNEYPILTIGDGTAANEFELPTRFGYPNYTCSTNREHVNEALSRMGGENNMHTPLWWSYKKREGGNRNPHPNASN